VDASFRNSAVALGPVSNGKPEGPLKKATEAQLKELELSGVKV